MSKLLIILLLFFAGINLHAQTGNPKYNQALADSLGGDDYGMKQYIFVMLKTGKGEIPAKAVVDSLFAGHMQNIGRLVNEGKLIVAGPMQKNTAGYRGIFILNVKTVDEAKLLLDTDPAVKAGLLDPELYQWYGSAALPMYLKFHDHVKKKNF
jgi:uncharacterized protein YciI